MSFVSTKKEIAEIKELLEAKDHCKMIPPKSFNTIWFRGDNGETELRLNFLGNLKLIVSRVCFHNRRQGTMTAVMQLLDKYCKKYGIVKLCIQSVETKEMSDFCKKWDIKPDPYASFQIWIYGWRPHQRHRFGMKKLSMKTVLHLNFRDL